AVSSFQIVLVNGATESLLGTADAGATSATLALPGSVAASSSIVVRAVAGSATGAPSAPVALLTTTPPIAAPQYDGSTLAINWTASSDAGVLGYSVTVSQLDKKLIASATTSVASVAFTVAFVDGYQYQI